MLFGSSRHRADNGIRWRVLACVVVFGIAFGWVEAATVTYLGRLVYPDGFEFPLVMLPADLAAVELAREAATLLILGAVAVLGARSGWGRTGLFALAFGVWDLVYYAGLYLAQGWPPSWDTWDLLFLIPGLWTGPVWAPSTVSVLLISCGALLFVRGEAGRLGRARPRQVLLAAGSLALIIGAFLANHLLALNGGTPQDFPELIFFLGIAAGLAAFADLLWTSSSLTR